MRKLMLLFFLIPILVGCNAKKDSQNIDSAVTDRIVYDEFANVSANAWYQNGQDQIDRKLAIYQSAKTRRGAAKNIILFIGDGMSIGTVTASRILMGQLEGRLGEEGFLSFGHFPYTALVKTYNVDAQVPDSAGTMTAIMSGVKTNFGLLGVGEEAVRGDCSSEIDNRLISAMVLAEIAGMSTGIVSTARITHATPAATYANSVERGWEDISLIPSDQIIAGCQDIALQLLNLEDNLKNRYKGVHADGIDVVMGGGRRHFFPLSTKSLASGLPDTQTAEVMLTGFSLGRRSDGRNLVHEWINKYPDGCYIDDLSSFNSAREECSGPMLGLFSESHMGYEEERKRRALSQPSLSEMTVAAIDKLSQNKKGFFLMVESGRIDHAHHANSAYSALHDTIEFSVAVKRAVDSTNVKETLILVTADHGHVMTISGYPKRGNPILGKVISFQSNKPTLDEQGLPFTTLGYQNGPGFHNFYEEFNADYVYEFPTNAGRKNLSNIDTEGRGFHQEALIPLHAETHSGEDVALYAQGPGAHLVAGTIEQNVIFHIMDYAADLRSRAMRNVKAHME